MMSFHNSNLIKNTLFITLAIVPTITFAYTIAPEKICDTHTRALFCKDNYKTQRDQVSNLLDTTQQTTNAPLHLINETQNLWLHRIYKCKADKCIQNELSSRIDELNTYSSLNQSLTQHFFKYTQGKVATPNTYLQIHQLDQKRIKVEGLSYTHKHHEKGQHFLIAYSNNTTKESIQLKNTDDQCIYELKQSKALLTLKSDQPTCQHFSGVYRLYD